MKVLITGAKGFIGSHLGNFLHEKGHDVRGVDNECHPSANEIKFECFRLDSGDVDVSGYDAIVHLAAHINVDESLIDPLKYFANNTHETARVLESVRINNPTCLFLLASTSEVYGSAQSVPMDESHALHTLSPYAESKRLAESVCIFYRNAYGINTKIIRNFNVFGEFQNDGEYGGVIAIFRRLAKQGKDLPVHGDGTQVRDYVHVSYLTDAYHRALTDGDFPNLINLGAGNPIKIIDIANYFAKKYGVGVYFTEDRKGQIRLHHADVSRLKDMGMAQYDRFWDDLDRVQA